MKKTIKLVGVAIFAMSLVLVSCDDDIIDVLDIDFDTSISEDIPVVIDQGQESVNETLVVSLDNDDTHDYLSNIEESHEYFQIPKAPVRDGYSLSPSQRRMWILSQLNESNVAYNLPGIYQFNGQ